MRCSRKIVILSLYILLSPAIADTLQQRFDPKLDYHNKVIPWNVIHNEGVIRQKLDASCGAAALATLLKYYYGLNVTEADMMHFAVLCSINEHYVVLADPAHGNNRYPIDKFLEKWNTRNDPNYRDKILVPVPLKAAEQLNIKKDYFNNPIDIHYLAKKLVKIRRTLLFY